VASAPSRNRERQAPSAELMLRPRCRSVSRRYRCPPGLVPGARADEPEAEEDQHQPHRDKPWPPPILVRLLYINLRGVSCDRPVGTNSTCGDRLIRTRLWSPKRAAHDSSDLCAKTTRAADGTAQRETSPVPAGLVDQDRAARGERARRVAVLVEQRSITLAVAVLGLFGLMLVLLCVKAVAGGKPVPAQSARDTLELRRQIVEIVARSSAVSADELLAQVANRSAADTETQLEILSRSSGSSVSTAAAEPVYRLRR